MNSAYLSKLIRAFDPPICSAAVVPVMVGTAAAHYFTGIFEPLRFVLTLLGMFLAQLGINLHNDYYDSKTGVDRHKIYSFVSIFSPKAVLFLAWICFLVAFGIGLYLDHLSKGHTLLILAGLGGVLGYFYSAPPIQFSYLGVGEIVTFFCFGPLAVSGSYYVQTQSLSPYILWEALPVGLITSAILFVHHFAYYQNDQKFQKKNLVARMGAAKSARFLPLFLHLPYLILSCAVVIGQLPVTSALVLLSLPLAVRLMRQVKLEVSSGTITSPLKSLVLSWHFLFGLTLGAGLLLGR